MILPKNQVTPIDFSDKQDEKEKPSFLLSTRFLMTLVMFFGYAIHYLQRTNMSIAIVCMVNSTAVESPENATALSIQEGTFVWSKPDQGLILAAYFYGYLITQVPGGWLSMKFGGRVVILGSMLVSSILTLVTPFLVNYDNSPWVLITLRFFIGLFHGFMFPAVADIFAQWSPTQEKSRIVGFSQAGINIGSFVSSFFGGYLCERGFYEGWGSIFILFGTLGLVWLVMLVFLASTSPNTHRFISQVEREYLALHIPTGNASKKAIFTSKACWCVFLCHFCANWCAYLFLTQTPTYMKDVLKFDITANGVYSSLPFLAASIVVVTSSWIADKLISCKVLSVKHCRRLFNSIGMFTPMLITISLGFIDSSRALLAVGLLTVGLGMLGCVAGAGFVVNLNDIGGQHYSGMLYAISNTFGTIPGFVAPYLVGIMTPSGSISEWRMVFMMTVGFYLVGGLPYILFAEARVEPWAIVDQVESEKSLKADSIQQEKA